MCELTYTVSRPIFFVPFIHITLNIKTLFLSKTRKVHLSCFACKPQRYALFIYVTFVHNSRDPKQLSLEDKDLPTRAYNNEVVSDNIEEGQYVMFQPSSLEKDGGQSTIPFIDMQNVVSAVPVPLSGVGTIHRGSETSAGFLGLVILTYNITSHLEEIHVENNDFIKTIVN